MINKLTKKQEDLMKVISDEWINLSLHGKLNEEEVEAGVKWMYYASELKEPKVVFVKGINDFVKIFMSSVGSSVRASVGSSVRDSVGASVRDSVGSSVRDSVWDSVGASVRASVGSSVRDSVRDSVRASVRASVRDSVWTSVWASVWASVGASVWDSVWYSVSLVSLCGDSDDMSFADFFIRTGIITPDEKTKKYIGYLKGGAFYAFFFEKVAFIMCPPSICEQDEQKRLHSLIKPALVFPDGTELYHIHGVRFTKEQWEKAIKATTAEVISWEDIDQRSAILQDRPLNELLDSANKKLIDHSDECGGYDLYEIEIAPERKAKILSYKGWSSDKPYIKFVPPESINALETVAKLRHQTVAKLKQSIRS